MAGDSDQRSLSDFNVYLGMLIDLAEKRENEHMRYVQELEQQIEALHELFNEMGEVAIGFHDLIMDIAEQHILQYDHEADKSLSDLYMRYTEVIGKRNDALFSQQGEIEYE